MSSRRTLLAFALGLAVAWGSTIIVRPTEVEAQTGANQPYMQSALNSLLAAKSSLENGATNKGGHRVKAIGLVNQAIVEVQAGMAFAN
jgi:hypothetical protein